MKTSDLIDMMAQDNPAVLPKQRPLLISVAIAVSLSTALVLLIAGLRTDFIDVIRQPLVQAKYLLPLLVAVPCLWYAAKSRQPEASLDGSLRWTILPAAIVLALLVSTLASLPSNAWASAIMGQSMLICLSSIPVLATPILAALLWVMRRGASSQPALTGALSGLAAGGLSASVYALHCFEDNPAFYGVWYSVGIIAMGVIGQQIGKRLLKW